MQIITDKISVKELKSLASTSYYNLVKAVVDIDLKILAIDSPLHADLESMLLEDGSKQSSLWGINLHPDLAGTPDFVEFDSMINLRPNQNNPSRDVLDPKIRTQIISIVNSYTNTNA